MFTASQTWSVLDGPRGCSMINALAELDPSHRAYPVIVEEKRWVLALFEGIVRDAGVADPEELAGTFAVLHEGALVAVGVGVVGDAFVRAQRAAAVLLAARLQEAGLPGDRRR